MAYELEPCPFCGGEATWDSKCYEHYSLVFVVCKECGARTNWRKVYFDTDEGWTEAMLRAAEDWQRRSK